MIRVENAATFEADIAYINNLLSKFNLDGPFPFVCLLSLKDHPLSELSESQRLEVQRAIDIMLSLLQTKQVHYTHGRLPYVCVV